MVGIRVIAMADSKPADGKWKNYAMISLSIILLASLGLNAMPQANYYCDASQAKAYCFDMSSTLKTCYTLPNRGGGKVCGDLWKKIPDPVENTAACSPYVVAYTDNGKYFCDKVGKDAKCVKDDTLEMGIV